MKTTHKLYIFMLVSLLALGACKEEEVNYEDSPYETTLYEIKILNAGSKRDSVVVGTVNENTKRISFPVMMGTSLSGIRFEAKLSDGAQLDSASYVFQHNVAKSITIKNGTRRKEYLVTLKDKFVWGADFLSGTVYDFSANPAPPSQYPHFDGASTRSADFDGKHMLVVSRKVGGVSPHLLRLSDLKDTVTSKPIMLKTTGISGGTFAVSSGRLAQGHIYICNLANGNADGSAVVKLYHWSTPESEPEVIFSYWNADGWTSRYGDNMSLDLDEQGNGYVFFGNNQGIAVLRATITNFTNVTNPNIIKPIPATLGFQASFNKVDGIDDEYILTGHEAPITLVDADGNLIYKMTNTTIPVRGCDARVINYNKERYLILTTLRRDPTKDALPEFKVYDITAGSSTKQALELFDSNPKEALFSYSLDGASSANPGSCTGWGINDDGLYLMGANVTSGFAIFKFLKKE